MDKSIEQNSKIILFQSTQIRRAWHNEAWFYSLVDIVGALTESANPTDYLKKLRKRDEELGVYLRTTCPQVAIGEYKKYKNISAKSKANLRDKT